MKTIKLPLMFAALLGVSQLRAASTTQPALSSQAQQLEAMTMEIAPRCVASTVGILDIVQHDGRNAISTGSGVIISADGLILTAGHVIQAPGKKLMIRFVDGHVVQGIAIGLDHLSDTGLARITDPAPPGGWVFSEMAPDDSTKLGDWVVATGNAGNVIVDRDPPLRLGRISGRTADSIGTNCAMEPGDSGGPLFNLSGHVVGINSQIFPTPAGSASGEFLSLHVSIGEFSRQWKDLYAGMNANPDATPGKNNSHPKPVPVLGDVTRRALNDLAADNDPDAVQALADEKRDHRLVIKPDLMTKLLKKAANRDRGQITRADSSTQPSVTQQPQTQLAKSVTTAPANASDRSGATVIATKGVPAELREKVGPLLKQQVLQRFPTALISQSLLQHLLDESSYDVAAQKLTAAFTRQDMLDMGISADFHPKVIPTGRAWTEAGKTSLQTLSLFAPAIIAAGDCVVEIRDNTQAVMLGTIVGSDGWIITKAGDLPADPHVVLANGQTLNAKVIGRDSATDLALLKIDANNLTTAQFSDSAPLGEWVAAPTANPNQPAVGVISLTARHIPETFSHFAGEQKLLLGLMLDPKCVVIRLNHGMPAEAAGMMIGDQVFQLDGKPLTEPQDLSADLKKVKAGDTLTIMVHRAGKEIEIKPVVGNAVEMPETTDSIGETDNIAGGKLSGRRTNFPQAIQTDAALWADQCGGPLLNLQGQSIGIVIARYDRTCTFVLPSKLVNSTIAKLKLGA